jgi:hypothetical protein
LRSLKALLWAAKKQKNAINGQNKGMSIRGLATSDAITSFLLHRNEPNKRDSETDSERRQKDEEIELIPSILAQFA